MTKRKISVAIALLSLLLIPATALAVKEKPVETITGFKQTSNLVQFDKDGNLNPTRYSSFGNYVAASGDYAVVGAPNINPHGLRYSAGLAFLYKRTIVKDTEKWEPVKILAPLNNDKSSASAEYANFGVAVAMSDKYMVIGASGEKISDNRNAGAVYIFSKAEGESGEWTFLKRIVAMDGDHENPTLNERFGNSVAIDGEFIAIGATGEGSVEANSGAVYIFSAADTWACIQKIKALNSEGQSDANDGDYFGGKIAFENNILAVCAGSKDTDNVTGSGMVYIYTKDPDADSNPWKITTRIKAMRSTDSEPISDVKESAAFGTSISLSGNFLAIGAPAYKISSIPYAGKTYIFSKDKGGSNTWGLIKDLALEGEELVKYARFGSAVSVSGDNLAIGNAKLRKTFVFSKDANNVTKWDRTLTLNAKTDSGADYEQLGSSYGQKVVLNDKELFITAPGTKIDEISSSGTVYVNKIITKTEKNDKDNVVFKTSTQPKGVSVTVHENHKEAKTRDQLKSEFNTGSLDTMLGADIYEFDADVTPLELGYFGFITTSLGERKAGDVTLFKLYPDKPSRTFTYSPDKTPAEEGYFWITDHNNSDQFIDPNTVLEGGRAYTINYSVRDNGEFDLNPAKGTIHDPVVPGTSSGGGSGCVLNPQAGMSVELAGFFIAALIGIGARRFRRQ